MSAPKTALVVDDEAQLLRLVVRVLERAQWSARTAETAAGALEIFRADKDEIDLVLLDVNLSGGAGAAELLPELLAIKPDLAVVVMSGDALPDALAEALAAVGGQFLRKPFLPRTLVRFLESGGFGSNAASVAESVPASVSAAGPVSNTADAVTSERD